MSTRLLLLKLTATLAAIICGGCNMPNVTPQPVKPVEPQQVQLTIKVEDGKLTVNDATINVKQTQQPDQPRAEACDCGCAHSSVSECDANCPRRAMSRPNLPSSATGTPGPQIVSALRDSKPVVEMLTDFQDGQCDACDLAWSDWKTNGKSWPFVLVKRRGTGGKTSPTFRFTTGEPWSPDSYSTGALLLHWQNRQ